MLIGASVLSTVSALNTAVGAIGDASTTCQQISQSITSASAVLYACMLLTSLKTSSHTKQSS